MMNKITTFLICLLLTACDFKNEDKRKEFLKKNNLRFLREYQLGAIKAIQSKIKKDHQNLMLMIFLIKTIRLRSKKNRSLDFILVQIGRTIC